MSFKILSLLDRNEWDRLLSMLPPGVGDVYFSPAYYDLGQYDGQKDVRCFVFEDSGDLAIYPFIARDVNSLGIANFDRMYYDIEGAYGYNGVASSSLAPEFSAKFHKAFGQYCADSGIIAEFTRFHSMLGNHAFSKGHMNVLFNRRTVYIDLSPGYEEVWKSSYDTRTRNMVRKALKSGVSAEFSSSPARYLTFYSLYLETMENVKAEGFYYFNEEYFSSMRTKLAGHHYMIDAVLDGRVIASGIFMHHGEHSHYHLSARSREFSNLGSSNLVIDAAVKRAVELGCKSMHMGGGYFPDDSLFKFKAGFSPKTADFHIGMKIHNEPVYRRLCSEWEKKFPEKKEKYAGIFLKYRR